MLKRSAAVFTAFLFVAHLDPAAAGAAWVKSNKKPTTALQGFKDSANGAVQAVLPWNWFGEREEPRARGYVRQGTNR